MKHFTFRKPQHHPVSRKRKLLFAVPLFFVFVLGAASIIVTGQTVGDGAKIRELEQEHASLTEKQRVLEENLAKRQSLSKLKEEAERLGYVPITSIRYIGLVTPVASR